VISDFLGTTLGTVSSGQFAPVHLTAFGEQIAADPLSDIPSSLSDNAVFYTGKPYDEDLQAYHFLYRNYSPTQARWTAADPSGFPDGPNQWLYVNNGVMNKVDALGLATTQVITNYPTALILDPTGWTYSHTTYTEWVFYRFFITATGLREQWTRQQENHYTHPATVYTITHDEPIDPNTNIIINWGISSVLSIAKTASPIAGVATGLISALAGSAIQPNTLATGVTHTTITITQLIQKAEFEVH